MRFLMVGLGSIGQRHVRNIRRLFGEDAEIEAYRVRKLDRTFSDNMTILDNVNVETKYNIKCYENYEEALESKPDAVFITNITSKHVEYAIKAANYGLDLFIEKPLSDSMTSVDQLQEIINNNHNIVYMGYQNRFHPCIKELRELIDKNTIGHILTVDTCYGERLTTMHTYEDYRDTYMARNDMGGGCLLNLQIHDIDYLQWIFGIPKNLYSDIIQSELLETDVENGAVLQYHADKLGYDVLVTSRSDFFQYPPVHKCIIVGELGRIEIDFNIAELNLYNGENLEEYTYPGFQRNDMFLEELKDFVTCLQERKQPEASLTDGINDLKIALMARESAEKRND